MFGWWTESSSPADRKKDEKQMGMGMGMGNEEHLHENNNTTYIVHSYVARCST